MERRAACAWVACFGMACSGAYHGMATFNGSVGVAYSSFLEKKGGAKWEQRWFELHGNVILYYKNKGDPPRGQLTLTQKSTVSGLSSGDACAFQVIFGGGKALKIRAETVQIAERWKTEVTEAIRIISDLTSVVCPRTEEVFVLPKHYALKKKLGQGAYGCVAGAVDEMNGMAVAIKKVKGAFDDMTDAKRILREVRVMRSLDHPNVLGVHDLLRPPSLEHFNDVYIVTKRMDQDLQSIIFSKTPLNEDQSQWILYQCLAGIKYLHSAGVVHRDLKPANLLVDLDSCTVKICDFGLSRIIHDAALAADNSAGGVSGDTMDGGTAEMGAVDNSNTLYVVTRWYRAPEVLLGYTHYDNSIDMWSLGCIFGELMHRRPLLNGDNFVNQLEKINDFLGTPTVEDLWYVTNEKALNFMQNVLPKKHGLSAVEMSAKFPGAKAEALQLLKGLLTMDPKKRLNAAEGVAHPYLVNVREAEQYEMDAGYTVDTDDIECLELTDTNLKRKMFQEIAKFHER